MICYSKDVEKRLFIQCHDGIGTLECQDMLCGKSDKGFRFFHHDVLEPGVTIGEHCHEQTEEIYYLVSGNCTLVYDGVDYPFGKGDFSLVKQGHSHGIRNTGTETAILIVTCI